MLLVQQIQTNSLFGTSNDSNTLTAHMDSGIVEKLNIGNTKSLCASPPLHSTEEKQSRKRKIDSASLLSTSFKMSMTSLGLEGSPSLQKDPFTRPPKRTKAEYVSLMQQTFSTFEAVRTAVENLSQQDTVKAQQHKQDTRQVLAQLSNESDDHLSELSVSLSSNTLHHACKAFPMNKKYIERLLVRFPESISEQSHLFSSTGSYSLPINIALKNKASLEVVELLANAEPSVLIIQDGYDDSASLNIALRQRSCDTAFVEQLLLANPKCIGIADRHLNLPLHVACAGNAQADLIRDLYMRCPEALVKENIHGETPLKIAQRNPLMPREVVDFLRDASGKH